MVEIFILWKLANTTYQSFFNSGGASHKTFSSMPGCLDLTRALCVCGSLCSSCQRVWWCSPDSLGSGVGAAPPVTCPELSLPFLKLPQWGSRTRISKRICLFPHNNWSLPRYLSRVCQMVIHSLVCLFSVGQLSPKVSILRRHKFKGTPAENLFVETCVVGFWILAFHMLGFLPLRTQLFW